MRALIVLMLAASPLALAAPADAQSVIQDGRWVTGKPKPAPTPPPPPPAPVEQAAPVASAPATVPDAPIAAPPAAPAPQFAPRAEVVQPLPPTPKPPVARAAVPPPPPAAGEAGAMPLPPAAAPAARAEAPPSPPPGATYAPPAKPLPPVRRADAPPPPPKPQRGPERRADAPPPPRAHHRPGHHVDAHPMPHHVRAAHADAKPHRARKHRWGEHRDGRWEGGWNAPGGWGAYRRPAQGWSLPRYWWAPEFVVVDHWTYDLAPPMHGDRWVRYYDDAVLVDRYGEVIDWVEGVDWNDADGIYYADDRDGYYDDYTGDYAPPGYPAGGYIANGYYYPPAVTHTIRIDSEPVVTSRTYVTEEVVTTRGGKGGKSYSRAQTKKCNC